MDINLMSGSDWRLAAAAMYIGLMGVGIATFSRRYMAGAKDAKSFWINAFLLLSGAMALTVSSNLAVLLIAWCIPGLCLPRLIAPINADAGAKAAAKRVQKTLLAGATILLLAVSYGAWQAQSLELNRFVSWLTNTTPIERNSVLLSFVAAAFLQSGIFPFNRWLVGTAWAPTPVSALMHAGIVNGGGILLLRVAPALAEANSVRVFLITIGLAGAFAGGLATLGSSDFKRGLASSTSTQMAFVLVQIGLGATTAAIVHLILHGVFKAFMFLGMARVQQDTNRKVATSNWPVAVPYVIAGIGWIATLGQPGAAPWMPTFLLVAHWISSSRLGVSLNALILVLTVGVLHAISELGPQLPALPGMRPLVDFAILAIAIGFAVMKSRPSRRIFLASLQAGQAPQ